jgi:hypothetical protein
MNLTQTKNNNSKYNVDIYQKKLYASKQIIFMTTNFERLSVLPPNQGSRDPKLKEYSIAPGKEPKLFFSFFFPQTLFRIKDHGCFLMKRNILRPASYLCHKSIQNTQDREASNISQHSIYVTSWFMVGGNKQ